MSDRVFFGACGVIALGLIALALVWPQGEGARSPGPFSRPLSQPPPSAAPAEPAGPRKSAPVL
jgi:hypothetical protein